MSRKIRFNHVFAVLMLLCGICVFIVPIESANRFRGGLDGLMSPVAYPVRRVAQVLTARVGVTGSLAGSFDASATSAQAAREIDRLRNEVASLGMQLERLRQLNENRDLAGPVQDFSAPFKVIGAEPRSQMLTLNAAGSDGLREGMAVVCKDGMVGRLTAVGATGAQVQLITHPRSRVFGVFKRIARTADGSREGLIPVETVRPLVEGRSDGRMAVYNLHFEEASAKIKPGDLVLISSDEQDWSITASGQTVLLEGQVLGVVEQVREQARSALHAEVLIKPQVNLLQLEEVMVVTGRLRAAAKQPAAVTPAAAPAQRGGNSDSRTRNRANSAG